jgi:hypothetical protein
MRSSAVSVQREMEREHSPIVNITPFSAGQIWATPGSLCTQTVNFQHAAFGPCGPLSGKPISAAVEVF